MSQLEDERAFSDAVLENAGALIVVLDKEGRVQRFNRACEELTGYRSEEICGKHVWELLLVPEEIDPVKSVFNDLKNNALPNQFTNYWIAKDQTRYLIKWSNVVMTNVEGEFAYVIALGTDITQDNKEDQERIEQAELLERIFENTHTLIAYMDTDFNFIRVNQAYADMDNKSIDEFIGKNHFDLYPNPENEAIFNKVLNTGETHFSYAKSFEYQHSPEKGVTHWDWSLSPIKDDTGNIIGMLLVLADVSERIYAQEALLRNEDAMNTAQSIAHFGSWDWDILTGELAWSDEIYRIFGQEPQSFPATYDAFLNTIHEDDREDVVNAVNAAVEDPDVEYLIEHRVVRESGEIRMVLEQGEIYRDDSGRPVRMIGTVQDITEQRASEEELRLKELAIQNSISAIAMADLDAKLTYVNQAFLDTWGYEREDEVLGQSAITFWKYPEQVEVMVNELTLHGSWVGEMLAVKKSGEEMCIRVSANVTFDNKNRPINMMASFIDVTQQNKTEASLKLNQELLSKAQEIAHVGSWDWDILSGKLAWSDETYRIFGRDKAEFKESYEHFLECVHPDDKHLVDEKVQSCINNPDESYYLEHRVIQPSGEVRDVLEQGIVYYDDSGKPYRMVGSVLDNTERKKVMNELEGYKNHLQELVEERTEEMQLAKEEAENANKLKSEFLSRMSHELRTPMNAIIGFSQLLNEEELNEVQVSLLHEVSSASHHLLQLINEVLNLTRIETGKIDLQTRPVSIADVIQESVSLVKTIAREKNVRIENYATDDEIYIEADFVRLKEVMLNLLDNAIKYNNENGFVTVVSELDQDEQKVRIKVKDSGEGLDKEQLKVIFEPFNRLGQEYGHVDGTGIGLTISKQLVELMEGEIDIESTRGKGTIFTISFPLISVKHHSKMKKNNEQAAGKVSIDKERQVSKILYIEDNLPNMRLMERIIEKEAGWELLKAVDAETGIQIARNEHPDVILLDIHLPGMDGYEALKKLKEYEETRDRPVIALSADALPRDVERGILAGFKRYITKPIQINEVRVILEEELSPKDPE